MHRYTHTQTYTQRKANTYSQFQSLYSVTCFVSIYKCFARPSQGLFLCTALSCRALTVLHAAPSWCFCNTASTSQSIAVWDPRGIASVCGGNSCIGEQQLVGFGCPAHAHISGPRSAPLRPTPAAPTNQSIAFSDPRGTACVGGGALRAPANKSSSDLPL